MTTTTKPQTRTGLNRRQAREAIANRETFVNSTGSLRGFSGDDVRKRSDLGIGDLNVEETFAFYNSLHLMTYVVYSYDTPIAWVAAGTGYRVKQKFSQTTSCHMGLTNFGY